MLMLSRKTRFTFRAFIRENLHTALRRRNLDEDHPETGLRI